MIKANRNQLGNVRNPYQGPVKKVLCVCSAGLLRSPSMADLLHAEFGLNTRACGSSKDFALIPITEALIYWAEEIVFVNHDNYDDLDEEEKELLRVLEKPISILSIPDDYDWGNLILKEIIFDQYVSRVKLNGQDL